MTTKAITKSTKPSKPEPVLPTGEVLGTTAHMTKAAALAFVKAESTSYVASCVAITRYVREHSLTGDAVTETFGIVKSTVSKRLAVGGMILSLSMGKPATPAQALAISAVFTAYGQAFKNTPEPCQKGSEAERKAAFSAEASRLASDKAHRDAVRARYYGRKASTDTTDGTTGGRDVSTAHGDSPTPAAKATPTQRATNAATMLASMTPEEWVAVDRDAFVTLAAIITKAAEARVAAGKAAADAKAAAKADAVVVPRVTKAKAAA